MRDQGYGGPAMAALALVICVPALAAPAIVLSGLYASVRQPPPAHLIRCAAALDGWPCGPDPAMLRSYPRPMQRVYPPPMQFESPVDPPRFAPSR